MAKLYNQIGSQRELIEKLKENGIYEFENLDHVREFRNSYRQKIQKIREGNKVKLQENIVELTKKFEILSVDLESKIGTREELLQNELIQLNQEISNQKPHKNFIEAIIGWFRLQKILKRRHFLETNLEDEISRPFRSLSKEVSALKDDLEDKQQNEEKWVSIFSKIETDRMERILKVFIENRHLYYGAEGEDKAKHELAKLPDTYHVINDFRSRFYPPIHNKKDGDSIFSVQIDHLVVGPTGLYIVETKNWSDRSTKNHNLYSPVKQLKRFSFVIFVIINKAIEYCDLENFSNHWGNRKVSPQNILLLMDHKPREEFQFIKVLTIQELDNYITHGERIFDHSEVEALVNWLNQYNEVK